jgi:uncharacterized protein
MKWLCPICRKPTDSEHNRDFPFCSERCRLADLGAWASGKYVIPESATAGTEDSAPENDNQH